MVGLFLSLLLGAAVGGGLYFAHLVPFSGFLIWGLATFIVTFILLGRRANKRLEPLLAEVQKHIQAGRIEKATSTLEQGFSLAKWHPLLGGQIEAQLGMLLYIAGKADDALPHLVKASRFVWPAQAMLGCSRFKKKEPDKMRAAFEKAVRHGRKDALSWTVYAYCLRESGHKDEALAVLERARKRMKKADHRLEANLERLREGKPLKTAPYGEQWMQFRLDRAIPPAPRGPRNQQLDANHPALRGMRGKRMRRM